MTENIENTPPETGSDVNVTVNEAPDQPVAAPPETPAESTDSEPEAETPETETE